MRILGIDPGTRLVGFAMIQAKVPRPVYPKHFALGEAGVLKADTKVSVPNRIGALHVAMHELVLELQPSICAIEGVFFGVNAQSALKVGQARGALLSALARCGVPVVEIAPTRVKRLITGQGHADKEAICVALERIFGFSRGKLPYDVTDALAIALSFGLLDYSSNKSMSTT